MPRFLLDTHAFIWWNQDRSKLPTHVLAACENPQNPLFLSLASVWEMQIKITLGKLDVADSLKDALEHQQAQGLQLLEIAPNHIYATAKLPMIHADPFDRLLVAQAMLENMTLVTADRKLMQYAVEVLW